MSTDKHQKSTEAQEASNDIDLTQDELNAMQDDMTAIGKKQEKSSADRAVKDMDDDEGYKDVSLIDEGTKEQTEQTAQKLSALDQLAEVFEDLTESEEEEVEEISEQDLDLEKSLDDDSDLTTNRTNTSAQEFLNAQESIENINAAVMKQATSGDKSDGSATENLSRKGHDSDDSSDAQGLSLDGIQDPSSLMSLEKGMAQMGKSFSDHPQLQHVFDAYQDVREMLTDGLREQFSKMTFREMVQEEGASSARESIKEAMEEYRDNLNETFNNFVNEAKEEGGDVNIFDGTNTAVVQNVFESGGFDQYPPNNEYWNNYDWSNGEFSNVEHSEYSQYLDQYMIDYVNLMGGSIELEHLDNGDVQLIIHDIPNSEAYTAKTFTSDGQLILMENFNASGELEHSYEPIYDSNGIEVAGNSVSANPETGEFDYYTAQSVLSDSDTFPEGTVISLSQSVDPSFLDTSISIRTPDMTDIHLSSQGDLSISVQVTNQDGSTDSIHYSKGSWGELISPENQGLSIDDFLDKVPSDFLDGVDNDFGEIFSDTVEWVRDALMTDEGLTSFFETQGMLDELSQADGELHTLSDVGLNDFSPALPEFAMNDTADILSEQFEPVAMAVDDGNSITQIEDPQQLEEFSSHMEPGAYFETEDMQLEDMPVDPTLSQSLEEASTIELSYDSPMLDDSLSELSLENTGNEWMNNAIPDVDGNLGIDPTIATDHDSEQSFENGNGADTSDVGNDTDWVTQSDVQDSVAGKDLQSTGDEYSSDGLN